MGSGLLLVLLLALGLDSIRVVRGERTNGPAINEAGRLRMLSQAIAKYALDSGPTDTERLEQAIRHFDRNLRALQFGDAALTIQAAPAEVAPYLSELQSRWHPYREAAFRLVLGDEAPETVAVARAYIRDHNLGILQAADAAVTHYEQHARSGSERLVERIEGLTFVGFLLFLLIVGTVYRSVHPLLALSTEARRAAEGHLSASFAVTTRDEVGLLADALQRMVGNLQAHIVELEDARARALAADLAKSDFLATMSHELRTPMNGVIGMAELLAHTRLDDDQRASLQVIQDCGENLLALINDILDFSKIEAGRLELVQAPFEIGRSLQRSLSVLEVAAQKRGLHLGLAADPALPPWGIGDARRLEQVLINLLGNAVKFTEEGHVLLHALPTLEGLRLEVEDSGVGIPPERLDDLFNRFVQLDTSSTRSHGGTGLGLAITKALVEKMGGTIGVTSVVGHGSRFWVEVPLPTFAPPPEQAEPQPALAEEPRAEASVRYPILLVDDNPVNRKVIAGQLEKLGYPPTAVASGAKALEVQATRPHPVVLLDLEMPGMHGFDVVQALRARGDRAFVVALTGHAGAEREAECLAAGMDCMLTKPCTMHDLQAVLPARHLATTEVLV